MVNKSLKEKAESIAERVREVAGNDAAININMVGKKYPKGVPDFVFLFQVVSKELAKDLSPSACKVILYFISMLQYGNHVGCDQTTLAEELGLTVRTINGAVAELKLKNVIMSYNDPQDKRRKVYMINPHQAWKGEMHKRQKVLKEADKDQFKLFAEKQGE